MKLRYYMRGLGIGILVTAVLMSVTIHGKTEKLTDEEIIERARELGMEEKYDSAVLSEKSFEAGAADAMEGSQKPEESSQKPDADSAIPDAVSGNGTGTQDGTNPESVAGQPQTRQPEPAEKDKDESAEKDKTKSDEIQPGEKETGESGDSEKNTPLTVQITVSGGDGSTTVARKLKEAGLIEDVLAYDKFLCSNGYDRKICTGTHSIPMDATEEEIAKILTTKAN